jgi:hypothetical protein
VGCPQDIRVIDSYINTHLMNQSPYEKIHPSHQMKPSIYTHQMKNKSVWDCLCESDGVDAAFPQVALKINGVSYRKTLSSSCA